MAKKSIVYIDGANLFYGALQGSADKWLNLEKYFLSLRQDDEIQKIIFFTARLTGKRRKTQSLYLRALETCELVQVVYGRYKNKTVSCRVDKRFCSLSKKQKVFSKPEEKRTDVNIAIQMVSDAYQRRCERMIVVSADSDLVPAVEMVRRVAPQIEVTVYIPSSPVLNPRSNRKKRKGRAAASELRNAAHKDRTLSIPLLKKSQFPNSFNAADGTVIKKPLGW